MFSPFKPSAASIRRFLERQARRSFSYEEVRQTRSTPPAGYVCDHNRVCLGIGETIFNAAVAALESWRMFPGEWVEAHADHAPIATGTNVAVVAKEYGVWSMLACRVVYRIDEVGPVRRVGFAYGTLEGHFAKGEERFLIEWNRDDDTVWYDLLAFSKPRALWARLLYPLVRRTQKRFARESKEAMLRAARRPVTENCDA